MNRFTVCLLTCAFSALLITELSSALIIKSHSKEFQIHKEDIPESGIKTLKNWFHRKIVFGSLQPIDGINIPGIFKKFEPATKNVVRITCSGNPECADFPDR